MKKRTTKINYLNLLNYNLSIFGQFYNNAIPNEKNAYRINNQRIVLLNGDEEKRGATNSDASEEKKPQPKTSKANITEPTE
jgi:hypothetical protein